MSSLLFRLILLFTIIPILELALLIEVGRQIGTGPTVGLVLLTGFVGAFLAKKEGVSVLYRVKESFTDGQLPTDDLLNGVFIIVGGAFLLTPGLLTDFGGFICIIPYTRNILKKILYAKLQRLVATGKINLYWE